MGNFSQTVRAIDIFLKPYLKRKSIRYGVPFMLVVVGGSFGLSEFTHLRYQFSNVKAIKPEDAKKYGIEMKKPGEVTLETEFEKIKQLNIDDWEQVRGPRPWEETTEETD